MSNFNDKISELRAFSANFEGFKSDIEVKLDKLAQPTDLSDLVKKDDLNKLIKEVDKELKKAKFDEFAFDSARRTFGEEIGVLKSFVDKEIAKLQSSIVEPKSYDSEIKAIESRLGGFVGTEEVKKLISKTKKPKDFSADIEAVKKSIPKQIDNTKQVESLKLSTDKQIKKLTDTLSKQSKQIQELSRLILAKDTSGKVIKSLTESIASINKRVESMSSDNTVSTLKSDIAAANKQIVKLQNDFTNFKNAFEE